MSDYSEHPISLDGFDIESRIVAIEELGEYDDLSSWPEWAPGELAELNADERIDEMRSFRGANWAKLAVGWTPRTVPPIVIATLLDGATAIADGRGRTSYAIGMGWPTIPVTFLTERRAATHQRTMREPNDTIAVGLSWESPEGTRRITGERDMPDGRHVYLVLTGENPLATLLSAADVRFDIRRDTAALANRTAGRAQKQREREQDAERADLDGFEQKFSPLQRGKVIERLTQQMRVGGVFASRRDHIRRLVDAGYIVISSSGERRLANPNMTSYYTEKDLTKTALDYAEYLETK